jgi:ABC-type phosphate transport system auxiliary subunit
MDGFKRYAQVASEHGFTREQIVWVCNEVRKEILDLQRHPRRWVLSDLLKRKSKVVMDMNKAADMVRQMMADEPCVLQIDLKHKVLVCNAGGGRIRLIALSDLIDPYEVEQMEAEQKLKELNI